MKNSSPRKTFNVLVISNPGAGKSQAANWIKKIDPNVSLVTMLNSSVCGISSMTVRTKDGYKLGRKKK